MFAIEITETNLPKILKSDTISIKAAEGLSHFIRSKRRYYFVTGYVSARGGDVEPYGLITQEDLLNNFEYDADKIQHDWDQIVRFEKP